MIVAGFGFRSGASMDSLHDALQRASGVLEPALLATHIDKRNGLAPLGGRLGVAVMGIPADVIAQQETLTQSASSLAARNTGSVAEAAALAAIGPGARLVAPREISADGMATCALAISADGETI
ncbi:cobalamin biosynthesis protein [Pontivivens insulae]|uniref:CobE/GbiG C-terminal domain-containing protein n=1 Tax=Pontivivens insulae TaxID=1639689 RepID=A0A2R8ACZ2_9RHOB|nr:cobalamin biosynthesis protein [Pontivivens insulae]RED14037.1 cobalt-precorrin 5A hydrolase [Pontivivens insulae]SPF30111.1 hypothetical protein POI8812_02442 [Pontivivens insulae]